MRVSSIKILIAVTVCVSALLYVGERTGAQSKANCLKRVQRVFGVPAHLRPSLFDVGKDYALQFKIEGNCEIRRVDVSPKYAWEEVVPSWKEPDYQIGRAHV